MSRQSKKSITGLTISDILHMTDKKLSSYTPSQQRQIISRAISAGNKRIRNLEKLGYFQASALKELREGGSDYLSIRGKTGNDLRLEFERARSFLRRKTSLTRNWSAVVKEVQRGLNERLGSNLNREQTSDLIEAYDILKQMSPEVDKRVYKYRVMSSITDIILDETQMEPEQIANYIQSDLNHIIGEDEYDSTRGMSQFLPEF